MKPQLALLFALFAITLSASAQKEYKLAKSSGKLNLNISGATVEGYDGNEIIFSLPENQEDEVDERAKGLKAFNSSGFKDNSGLGFDVTVKGDDINVNPVSLVNQPKLIIKLPRNIRVSFSNNSNIYQDTVILKNLKTEIDVSVTGNDIVLINNVGPMNIKTLHGSVDASFPTNLTGPISIISVHGHVDVALPVSAKASVEAISNYGKIYAADDLKIAINPVAEQKTNITGLNINKVVVVKRVQSLTIKKTETTGENEDGNTSSFGDDVGINAESLNGKINGGGIDLILKSNHGNIYIREKK
ncbi:hypothetical protein GJU39_11865 [Pedobacter petrophilus]|uniref:DUF4097 family beta strand repeat protein n=1 Tax=Pedobacter petrophilus TaxID=1908241 RepID=A0A7K0G0D5_9SPHI|nr:DUF4097 family beta strand repeat-containing protein [Pedobacter petrophilus]MRX76784.1 hypothetical protein [Pedobacter petrophilus]